jgi:hypothetical protein
LRTRQRAEGEGDVTIHAEKRIVSKDGLLYGDLDAYFIRPNGMELLDYKTGPIQDEAEVKRDYADQLYFYAYLLLDAYGSYPRSLRLVSRDGSITEVAPEVDRSVDLANEMRSVLSRYNESVARAAGKTETLASPSSDACRFCVAKPTCSSFWKALSSLDLSAGHHVVRGTQTKSLLRSKLGGGSIEIRVHESSLTAELLTVTRVYDARYPEIDLETRVGQELVLTGLRQPNLSNASLAEATGQTVITVAE